MHAHFSSKKRPLPPGYLPSKDWRSCRTVKDAQAHFPPRPSYLSLGWRRSQWWNRGAIFQHVQIVIISGYACLIPSTAVRTSTRRPTAWSTAPTSPQRTALTAWWKMSRNSKLPSRTPQRRRVAVFFISHRAGTESIRLTRWEHREDPSNDPADERVSSWLCKRNTSHPKPCVYRSITRQGHLEFFEGNFYFSHTPSQWAAESLN